MPLRSRHVAEDFNLGDLTFIGRQSQLARWFARPFRRFLAVEAAGGVMLLIATAVALIWVNSPWGDTYDRLWGTTVNIFVGDVEIFAGHSLGQFVNDAFMALFFFVVGLEIKRELVTGQLKNPRDAALPAVAALGGMVVPAALYLVFNIGGAGEKGWGIPMATDIAFAVGIISLVSDRIPRRLRIFLLSLAIVDDIGAIIVIALFYSSGISPSWLIASGVVVTVILLMKQLRVWYIPLYICVGAVLWWTTFRSGVHATIAGVVLGLICPAQPLQSDDDTRAVARWLRDKPEVFPVDVRYAGFRIRESVSVAERLEAALHPMTSFAVIPVFALANAGVRLGDGVIGEALRAPVTWGIILGLVVGKTLGITAFTLAAIRLRIAARPRSLTLRNLLGLSMVAGIGFTVSLFVANLAFYGGTEHGAHSTASEPHLDHDAVEVVDEQLVTNRNELESNAKIGILFASGIASVLGLATLAGGGGGDED